MLKNSLKKVICIALSIITISVAASANGLLYISAQGSESVENPDGIWEYTVESDGDKSSVMITGYTGESDEITIPENINGNPVTVIDSGVFRDCTATGIKLPATLKKIGEEAFYNCRNLVRLDLPECLEKIGAGAFEICSSLETVSIGSNISAINSKVFADCENLGAVIISDSVKKIAADAFDNCCNITIYCFEDSYAYSYAMSNSIPVSTFVVEPIPNQRYTGKAIKPEVSVTAGGKELSNRSDFTVKYYNNTNAGTATVKISGINKFKALTSSVNFVILARSICEATVGRISDQTYTGSEITPKPRLTYNGKSLREGTDYTLSYSSNVNIGTAKVTINGIGNFFGTTTFLFNIVEEQSDSGAFQKILELCITALQYLKIIFETIISIFRR